MCSIQLIVRVQADEGKQINRRFKHEQLTAAPAIGKATGFVRAGHVSAALILQPSCVRIAGDSVFVPADEHHVPVRCILIYVSCFEKNI